MITNEETTDEIFRRQRRKVVLLGGVCLIGLILMASMVRWIAHRRRPAPIVPVVIPQKPKPKPYAPEGIVFHHSETPAKVGHTVINAERLGIINQHDHPNWATPFQGKTYYIGYHYVILPDGAVEHGRPELCVGTHARKYNNWLGICLVGAFHGKRNWWPASPTQAQKDALIKLSAKLIVKYNIPLTHIKRHRDVNQTNCPGDRFPFEDILLGIRDELHDMPIPSGTP